MCLVWGCGKEGCGKEGRKAHGATESVEGIVQDLIYIRTGYLGFIYYRKHAPLCLSRGITTLVLKIHIEAGKELDILTDQVAFGKHITIGFQDSKETTKEISKCLPSC